MSESEDLREKIYRNKIDIAFTSLNIAVSEIAQSLRNLSIAQLAIMKEDQSGALKEIGEISARLGKVEQYLDRMSSAVAETNNASE